MVLPAKITKARAQQLRLGIQLGRVFLSTKGKGRLHVITPDELHNLNTMIDLSRETGLTHAAFWATVKNRTAQDMRRCKEGNTTYLV